MSGEADRTMQRAEALMESHPDSALMLMRQIAPSDLHGKREKALYALLLTQAQYKNYIEVTDDSLISTAVDYFDRTDDLHHQMLAYHYSGQVNYDTKNYAKALYSSLLAYQLAKELDERFWIAMSARTLADIYHDTYNGSEEIEFSKIEYNNFNKMGKQLHTNHAILDLAKAYVGAGKYREALSCASQALDSAIKYKDDYLRYDAIRLKGLIDIHKREYAEAIKKYIEVCNSPYAITRDSIYLGMLYLKNGNNQYLRKYMEDISFDDDEYVGLWLKHEYYMSADSLEKAVEILSKKSAITDSIFHSVLTQNLSGTLRDYYDYEVAIKEAQIRVSKLIIYGISGISIIVAAVITCALLRYRRKQKAIIDRNIEIAQNLQEMISTSDSRAKETIHELFAGRFVEVDKLCRILYENSNSTTARKRISEEVVSFVKQLSEDKGKIKELHEYADKHYDDIMSHLKLAFPELKDADYRLFLYSILGFSNSAIAMFLNEDRISSVYSRRKRLKTKFRESDSEYKFIFIEAIS